MILAAANIAFEALLFALGLILPRTDGIWVIGGNMGLRYADNSMHFFRHCRRNATRRVVWLTRSAAVLEEVRGEGHEAHHVYSIRGLWLGMRARWHVFDVGPTDTGPTSRGARRLNLWHGIPLKDISLLKHDKSKLAGFRAFLRWIIGSESREYLVHPNRKYLKHMLGAFHVPARNVLLANLPRNAALLDHEARSASTKPRDLPWSESIQASRNQGQTIIGYFPTWRSDGEDRFLGANDPAVIQELNALLERHKFKLITKWHTCSYGEYNHAGRSSTADALSTAIERQPNILALDFATDLNPLLALCDVLITDYSSVLFDFLLTGKPQFFVPYDLARYRAAPGLLFDYESLVPGRIVHGIPELIDAIATLRKGAIPDTYAAKRAEMRKTFFEDERCSSRIVELMEAVP